MNQNGYGIATPLGSPLRDRINLVMLQFREMGFLQKLENKWWNDKGECGKEMKPLSRKDVGDGPRMTALRLRDLAGPLAILLIGIVVSILVALLEMIVSKYRVGDISSIGGGHRPVNELGLSEMYGLEYS